MIFIAYVQSRFRVCVRRFCVHIEGRKFDGHLFLMANIHWSVKVSFFLHYLSFWKWAHCLWTFVMIHNFFFLMTKKKTYISLFRPFGEYYLTNHGVIVVKMISKVHVHLVRAYIVREVLETIRDREWAWVVSKTRAGVLLHSVYLYVLK